ncbi:MAG: hypothetical protein ACTSWN_15805 [Promethearchaeota archaeon]
MRRVFLRILQIISAVLFMALLVGVVKALSPNAWNILSLFYILGAIKNILSYGLYALISGSSVAAGQIFRFRSEYRYLFESSLEPLIFQYLNMIFHMTDNQGRLVTYNSIQQVWDGYGFGPDRIPGIGELIGGQLFTIFGQFYSLLFILSIISAVFNFLLFIGRLDIKYSLYMALSLIGPFFIALIPWLFIEMGDLLVPSIIGTTYIIGELSGGSIPNAMVDPAAWSNFKIQFETYVPRVYIVDQSFLLTDIPADFTFFTNGGVVFAFMLYLLLELTFQTSYIGRVTQPSIERTKRLEGQIALLGEYSSVIEREQEETIRAKGVKSLFVSEGAREKEEKQRKSLIKEFFTGTGLTAIKEMLEQREREKERERLEEISSDTRRLNSYMKRLFEIDKDAKRTLTAAGSMPSQKNLVSSTIINMGLRVILLFVLVFFVANPILLYTAFGVEPIIQASVGFQNPEAVVTTVVPLILLFPFLAFLIRQIKRYRLTQIMLKRERESELLQKISELQEIEEMETYKEEQTEIPVPTS